MRGLPVMKRGVSLVLQHHHCPWDTSSSALGDPKVITFRRTQLLGSPVRRNSPPCSASWRFLKTECNFPSYVRASRPEGDCWSRNLAAADFPVKSLRPTSQIFSELWCKHWSHQARAASSARMASSASGGPPEGYRPNVGVCVVNAKNEVFVASRLDIPDSWQMPQGGVDDGEDPRTAAFRELREETGVSSVQMIGEVPEWLTYDFPPEVKAKITRLWGREWLGQAQKWFLFRFQGDESEVDLNGDGSEQPEFGEWKWLPAEEVLNKAVDFKRPVYAQAFKALAVHIDAWAKL